jgi:drug/metabolite transporter (DMT)-like permease
VIINLAFSVYPRRSELLAVGVGFIGILMLTQGAGIHGSPAGLLAIGLGTCGWALGSVLSQRTFLLAPGATGFASELLCGGMALLAMSALRGESWHLPAAPGPWVAWAYLVIAGTLIAFNAYMVLLARASSSLAASYTLVNPVVALFLGVTFGRESISAWEWLSAGVVLLGVVILLLGRRAAVSGAPGQLTEPPSEATSESG